MIRFSELQDRKKRLSICLMALVTICAMVSSAHGLDLNFKALTKKDLAALATAARGHGLDCPSVSRARKVLETKEGHTARLTCVSDDGKKSWDVRISGLPRGPAQFSYWDAPIPPPAASGLEIKSEVQPHRSTITDLDYSADGSMLYSVSKEDSRLIAWQTSSMRPVAEYAVRSMSLSPNHKTVIGVGEKVEILNADTGTRLRSFPVPTFSISLPLNALAINNQATQFAFAWHSEVVLYDGRSGRKTASLWGLNGKVTRLHYSSDGQYLIAGGYSDVVIWDARKAVKVMGLPMAAVFVQDDVMGLTKSLGQKDLVVFMQVKRANIRFSMSNSRFHGASADGSFATSNAAFNTVEFRSIKDGQVLKRTKLPERHDKSDLGRISSDLKQWASSKRDHSISVLNLETGQIISSSNASGQTRRAPDDIAVSYCEKAIGGIEGAPIDAIDPSIYGNRVSFSYEARELRQGTCEFSIGNESHTLQRVELNAMQVGDAELKFAAEVAGAAHGALLASQTKLKRPIDGPIPVCCVAPR